MLQLHNWQPQTCAIALWVHVKILSMWKKLLLSGLSYFKHASATKGGLMLQQNGVLSVCEYVHCVCVCKRSALISMTL